ncbi:MAG: ComEA family DNA-binding protein [Gaiellales bacterium]|nr:ComEA family DNA-binding protein [Gaiellales bacterium]
MAAARVYAPAMKPRRLQLILYVLAAAVVVAVGLWGLASYPGREGVLVPAVSAQGSGDPGVGGIAGGLSWDVSSTTSSTLPLIYVQVSGAVRNPGVHRVERGARLFQVLEAAGGLEADADSETLALAAVVADGASVHVPRVGETASGMVPAAPGDRPAQNAGPVSLSAASREELDALPGIGPALAAAIIAYRDEHGPFVSVEELEEVPGIGPSLLSKLKDRVVP